MTQAREEGQRWFEQAEEDVISARHLMDDQRFYLVCFLAQQIAEKALKGYLYSAGEQIVVGHGVERLCGWCAERDPSFAGVKDEIAVLDGYYIPTRYPNGLPAGIPARTYNRAAAESALALAQKTLAFASAQAENLPQERSQPEPENS